MSKKNGAQIIFNVAETGIFKNFRQTTKTNKPLSKPPKNVSSIWLKLSNIKALF
jgi:hypothetical protein